MSYLSFAEVSSSRAKKPGPGEEIKDEKQRWLKVVDMGLFNKLNCSLFLMIFAWCGFRLKELETSIRSQVAAEERAHKIVERLVLEVEVTRDFLVHSVSLIVFQGKMARIQGKGSPPKIFVEQLCTCQWFSPGPRGIRHTHRVWQKVVYPWLGIWQICVAPGSEDCQHWVDGDSRSTIHIVIPTFKPGILACL